MNAVLSCDEISELAAPFVLGALERDEMDAVRAHLADCPEAHAEFLELGSVVPALAETVELGEPPAALRGRILAAAAAEVGIPFRAEAGAAASHFVSAAAVPRTDVVREQAPAPRATPPPTPFPSAAERTLRAERRGASSGLGWALRIAAVLAIVVLGAWNLLLQGQLGASETYNRDVAAVLEVASQPGAMTAVLAPTTPGGPRGLAALSPDGSLTLAVRDLGPTSGSQVYETWSIVGDEAPVALGGFTVGNAGTGRFDGLGVPAQAGLTVALTLEPQAGATAPSSPPVAAGAMTAPPGGEAARGTDLLRFVASVGGPLQGTVAIVRP